MKERASEVHLPLLMIHGGEDRLSAAEGTRQFFESVTYADKELHIYPKAYHEPHNDLDWEEEARDIERWVDSHVEQQLTD